jgi:hypothetical protein
MSKDLSAGQQTLANFRQSLRQTEATAVELVDAGCSSRRPSLAARAALALSAGGERNQNPFLFQPTPRAMGQRPERLLAPPRMRCEARRAMASANRSAGRGRTQRCRQIMRIGQMDASIARCSTPVATHYPQLAQD